MAKLGVLVLAFVNLFLGTAYARPTPNESSPLVFVTAANIGGEYQLQANQEPINRVLDKITTLTGIPIHYSLLAQESVTTTCIESTIKDILDCLFNHTAAMVVRYPNEAQNYLHTNPNPAEIWIINTDNTQTARNPCCSPLPLPENSSPSSPSIEDLLSLHPEDFDKMLAMVKSSDPGTRVSAVIGLGGQGEEGNKAIREALQSALQDSNPEVRAQALNSLAKREGEAAVKELTDALQDDDVSVRLMAVDMIGANRALLQQSLVDTSATVRNLAATKLAALQPQ